MKIDLSNDDEIDNNSDSDTDWKDEDEEDFTPITKQKKKNIPKTKKSTYNADDDIAVPCAECNKIFSNSKALARHKRNTHIPEEQKCTCPLCGRRFSRSITFKGSLPSVTSHVHNQMSSTRK